MNHTITKSVAERLYHDSATRKRLLGIAGNPPALARVPWSNRPLPDLPLVGRDNDLEWLRRTKGDRLVSGQPGIGKTYLLKALVSNGGALFAVSEDEARLADAVRDQAPSVILVEDAHLHSDVLNSLCKIRRLTGRTFDIVADCWPGAAGGIQTIMNLPASSVRPLDVLAPPLIVELIHHIGIGGPDGLIDELVRQSNGRPGLAALLSYLCLRDDVQDVWRGDALARILSERFTQLVGAGTTEVLGAIALGGWGGMRLDHIAECLAHPISLLRDMLTKLAAAGVITEINELTVRVRPEPLRFVLVRDVFFNVQPVLQIDDLLMGAPDRSSAARTLCGAYARGARLAPSWLLDFVESITFNTPWSDYIYSSEAAARLFMQRHPEQLHQPALAQAALNRAPEAALSRLFEEALKMPDSLGRIGGASSLRNVLAEWIRSAEPDTPNALGRRALLLKHATASVGRVSQRALAIEAIAIAMSPQFSSYRSAPGSGGATGHVSQGLLTDDELQRLGALWPPVAKALAPVNVESWKALLDAVRDWVWPRRRTTSSLTERTSAIVREVADMLLRDLAAMNQTRPGVLLVIREMSRHGGFPSPRICDPETYRIIRESKWHADYKTRYPRQAKALQLHAKHWIAIGANAGSARIASLLREAAAAGLNTFRILQIAEYVARDAQAALPWFDSLSADSANASISMVFLRHAALADEPDWQKRVMEQFKREEVRTAVALIVLSLPTPPPEVQRVVLEDRVLLRAILRGPGLPHDTPYETIRKLLSDENADIAGRTAIWLTPYDQKESVPQMLFTEWRNAIVSIADDEPKLRELVKADNTIAFDWLAARLANGDLQIAEQHSVAHAATEVLDDDQRAVLLERVQDSWRHEDLTILLIRGPEAPSLYKALLASDRRILHLAPLRGRPNEEWLAKARVALQAGYTPTEIANAAYAGGHSWEGSEAEMWIGWMTAFEQLRENPDAEIREVAQVGHDYASERRNAALLSERRFRHEY